MRQNDEPERVAAGLALGVALGVLPTFGLGIVMAVFLAGLFRVNRVSAIVGTLICLPWVMPFFWALSYLTGTLVVGNHISEAVHIIKDFKSHSDMWRSVLERNLLLPYIIGNVLVTLAVSAMTYVAGLYAVRAYRKARHKARQQAHKRHGAASSEGG